MKKILFLITIFLFRINPTNAAEPATSPNLRYYYPVPAVNPPQTIEADVCVYGGTSGGVTAAVQAARMGKKAVLVELGTHLGGLTSGGLSAIDWGHWGKAPYGGMCMEFFSRAGNISGAFCSKAEKAYNDMVKEAGVQLFFEHRLASCVKDGNRIAEIVMENGNRFRAKMFVDATYEGDLMAAAGVSYHVGREANSVYQETINGIFAGGGHQFVKDVDPYVVEGDPKSGLLWGISAEDPGKKGDGDRRIQAYNFRMQFTRGGLPFPKPPNYDASRYELLLRYIKAGGGAGVYPHPGDNNNSGGFSTDHIGYNYDWPDGPATAESAKKDAAYFRKLYETREKIYQDHVTYQQGLVWFLAHDERVPQKIRDEINLWGLIPKQFEETGGWPHQLYIREGRRMISDTVMTEHHCRSKVVAEDSVGLGAYTMDSHNCQRIVVKGKVRNEGNVEVGVPQPYPISYRSIVPKESECANLFVPVALSSSHIAFGSIRMEPVFMILGQSSGTAAVMAIDAGIAVQKVEYAKLRERSLADKQVLDWKGAPAPQKTDAVKLEGVVVDDTQGEKTGNWIPSTVTGAQRAGSGYLHDNNANKGQVSITYTADIVETGEYEIYLLYPPNENRATNVPVTVSVAGAAKTVKVNQQNPASGRALLGKFSVPKGKLTTVTVSNADTDGHVIADGVQFLPVN